MNLNSDFFFLQKLLPKNATGSSTAADAVDDDDIETPEEIYSKISRF